MGTSQKTGSCGESPSSRARGATGLPPLLHQFEEGQRAKMSSSSRATAGNPNKSPSCTTESWDSPRPSYPNPRAASLQDTAKAVHQLLCLQKPQLPRLAHSVVSQRVTRQTLWLGLCPTELGKHTHSPGKQTALSPGLMPVATTATFGWASCATTQLRASARSSPVVAVGLAVSHCLPPQLAQSRSETSHKKETCTAWLGLHIGNRDKLLQKLNPGEAVEQEEEDGGGAMGCWGGDSPGKCLIPPPGAKKGKHPKV